MSSPEPISWQILEYTQYSPQSYCAASQETLHVTYLVYGYPTTFKCANANGTVTSPVFTAYPSCPEGTTANFADQVCIPDGANALLPPLSLEEAQAIAVPILLLWAMAWGFKQVARTLSLGDNHERD